MKKFFEGKDIASIVIWSLLGVVTAGIITVGVFVFMPEKSFPMTDLMASEVTSIDSWASENGVVVNYDYQYDEEIEKGMVISQDPAEGTSLTKDSIIKVVVSLGPDPELQIQLPDFHDYTLEDLQKFVDENRLSDVTYDFIYSDTVAENVYISMNIESEFVKRNDMIIFTLSNGPEEQIVEEVEIKVPDFSTYSRSEINKWASGNNVIIKYAKEASETVKKDEFIKQSVKAGSTIKPKATITITISTGESVKAIDLKGKTKSEVVTWQGDWDNRITITYKVQYSNDVAKNVVISNTPKEGSMKDGATMTVVLSAGKPIVNDYATAHKAYADLQKEVEALNKDGANITLIRSEYVTSTTVKKDCIISQDKSGELATGTTIKVSVSSGIVVTVPSNWTTEAELKSFCSSNNLISSGSSEYSTEVAKDKLITYDKKGQNVAEGEKITYKVSLGTFSISENEIKGKTVDQVNAILNEAKSKGAPSGWNVVKIDEFYDEGAYAKGTIFACDISGTTITARVSKGPSAHVGNYVGQNRNGITTTGLTVTWVDVYDDSVPKDQVISQSISSGEVVAAGTAITITYSKGPEVIVIPTASVKAYQVIYTNQADPASVKATIESELSASGFTNFSVVIEDSGEGTTSGVVWSQNLKGTQNLDAAIVIKIQP